MQAVVMSVPYTGTNFVAGLFTHSGFERIGLDEEFSGDCVRVAHCINGDRVDEALSLEIPIVLSLRHPYRVEESFIRKGKDVSVMLGAFLNLIRLWNFTDLIIPVDSEDRAERLDYARNRLNLPLPTDWEVVSSKSDTHCLDISDLSPSAAVVDFVNGNKSFFGQFYELV